MKKSILISHMVIFSILITGLIFTFQNSSAITSQSTSSEFHPIVFRSKALTPHNPIIIGDDNDFITFGFPGDGSPSFPYIIDGFSIINTSITDGIVVENTTKHFKITNNYVEVNWEGIRVRDIGDGTAVIANNQLKGCDSDGIVIIYANNTIIANNTGLEDHVGLRISRCNGIYAYNNTFIGGSPSEYICATGIYPSHSSDVVIINNTVDDFNRGIYTLNTTISLIANNTVLSAKEYGGIYLGAYSNHNTVINNTVLNNSVDDGIRLYNCDFNDISYNTVEDNIGHGCYLDYGAEYNVIHHNNFINNRFGGLQGCDFSTTNFWYQPNTNEGNYWSNWDGTYSYVVINGGINHDFFPLHSPVVLNWTDLVFYPVPDDTYEENDILTEAPEIPLEKTLYLIYRDIDFFRFTLNNSYNIEVTLEFNYLHINLDLFLLPANYTGTLNDILAKSEEILDNENIVYSALDSGIYYLLVECPDESYVLQRYRLTIALTGLTVITTLPNVIWILAVFISTSCVTTVISRNKGNIF